MTTHQVISDIKSALAAAYPEGEVRAFVRILFEEWMHYSTVDIYMRADSEVPPFMVEKMHHAVQRLLRHEPIQHIVGVAHFHGHRFAVSKHTLIPRPETEQLVDMIVDRNQDVPDLCVLDIGTGSGCIACSLARALRFAEVHAFDISQPALDLAAENARNLGVKVAFHHVDILNAVPQPQQFHIIVSNPPYICMHEQQLMEDNVLRYEPHSALFVPDNDPLLFYRAIARYASVALKPGGKLYFEINAAYGNDTANLLSNFHFADIEVARDFYGRDRFVSALWLP
ncbi:MAG: peptide chain release factor N(5)-glutamine methyltransferase [bacterium]|nr:peptide chain release factor N(5)-glutamine methyltransferase [bacterium]MDD6026127.1 peptide chain release factor N(5)-glutamine methyltransferase [bacterium]